MISEYFLSPHQMADAMQNLKHDKNMRVMILRSMVPGIFCAGGCRCVAIRIYHPMM